MSTTFNGTSWELPEVFDFEGEQVRYGVIGEGAPLVLLHGTPFSSVVWRRIAPYLAAHRRVYYFDLLGYGPSGSALVQAARQHERAYAELPRKTCVSTRSPGSVRRGRPRSIVRSRR